MGPGINMLDKSRGPGLAWFSAARRRLDLGLLGEGAISKASTNYMYEDKILPIYARAFYARTRIICICVNFLDNMAVIVVDAGSGDRQDGT